MNYAKHRNLETISKFTDYSYILMMDLFAADKQYIFNTDNK